MERKYFRSALNCDDFTTRFMIYSKEIIVLGRPALPHKRLIEMCHWMGSHFHDWIDHNGVCIFNRVTRMGFTFSDFWGKRVVHSYG